MKKSILNLEEYGVTELSYSEYQSINGGWVLRVLGEIAGHLANAYDAAVNFWGGESGAAMKQMSLAAGR